MSTSGDRSIGAAVERQMRYWEIAREQKVATPVTAEPNTHPFVTISRQVGSGGSDVAKALAEEVGWPLFDRELLQHMAGDDAVRTRIYETLDERDNGFIEESLRSFTTAEFRRNDYFHRLTKTVLALVRKGPAVILGRGADLVLPRAEGLRVRITSLKSLCVECLAKRTGLSLVESEREFERIERERERFVRGHFQGDAGGADRFDLSINLASLKTSEAIAAILAVLRVRGLIA